MTASQTMSPTRSPLGLLYVLLVVIMLAQGVWWVIFLLRVADDHAAESERRLAAESELARVLVSEGTLDREAVRARFPDLTLDTSGDTTRVTIGESARTDRVATVRRRHRMVAWEGGFFLALLALGSVVLLRAHRKEREFRRAHELFLAGVTHEFRTPLASVRLSAETLQRRDLDGPSRHDVLRRLVADVDRLQSLVAQVLAVTRQSALSRGDPVPIDLGTAVCEVVEELRGLVDAERGSLTSDLPPGHIVLGHPDALTVAVRNVLSNAVTHGRARGAPPVVSVSIDRKGGHVRLAVVDRGPGIPRHEQSRVFRAFHRGAAGRSSGGAGLGLYLARRNVEAMGGRIQVTGREGRGATFTIVLRAAEAA